MIQQTAAGDFAAASGGAWLPGVYASRQAAWWAFHFPDETLQRLTERICRGERRAITRADLHREMLRQRQAERSTA